MANWQAAATGLIGRAEPGWAGLWALLDAARHGAMALSLAAPLGVGVDLTYAAIELGEARDELAWSDERLSACAPTRLGSLGIGDDLTDAQQVIGRLVDVAIGRTLALGDDTSTPDDLDTLGRVLRKLYSVCEELARAAA